MQTRIITGVLAGAVFIGVLLLGGYWFAGLIALMAIVGYDEYLRMNKISRGTIAAVIGLVGVVLLLIPALGLDINLIERIHPEQILWFLIFILLAVTVATKNRTTIDHVGLLLLGIVYLGMGFRYMIETRLSGENGLFWTLFVFLCIWASDAGAYFTGNLINKGKLWTTSKLWPAISPNKTVEGAIGGVLIAVLTAIIFHFVSPDLLTLGRAASLGVVIAIVGTLGDLMQSAYKRVKGIKDTGAILPGHGGILDRTDSWLIVFPFLHLLGLI
ncbi:MAG: phosphatidate cytidylyltransferase [Gorillibacterium sp.]|nr:phosphatidate cytidylyltransferase [Gorillibacterium sp.]